MLKNYDKDAGRYRPAFLTRKRRYVFAVAEFDRDYPEGDELARRIAAG